MLSIETARGLAIAYAAYSEAAHLCLTRQSGRHSDWNSLACWAGMLIDRQNETGVTMHDAAVLARHRAHARRTRDALAALPGAI
jgi:hypothetical protein